MTLSLRSYVSAHHSFFKTKPQPLKISEFSYQDESSHINELEAEAVSIAVKALLPPSLPPHTSIHLVVDNTSTAYALKKGPAASFLLNSAVRKALQNIPRTATIEVTYIPSALNPVDNLSRGKTNNSSELTSVCGLVAGTWSDRSSLKDRACALCHVATLRRENVVQTINFTFYEERKRGKTNNENEIL